MTTNPSNWAELAHEYAAGLDREEQTDRKAFYHQNNGSRRAQDAISTLRGLEARFQKFIRA